MTARLVNPHASQQNSHIFEAKNVDAAQSHRPSNAQTSSAETYPPLEELAAAAVDIDLCTLVATESVLTVWPNTPEPEGTDWSAEIVRPDRTAAVNQSSDEEGLRLFGLLPRPWQRVVLLQSGGCGNEAADDLAASLRPFPPMHPMVKIAADISAGNKPLTYKQCAFLDMTADMQYDYLLAIEEWKRTRHLASLAKEVVGRTIDLQAADLRYLSLLACDDATLLNKAVRIAQIAEARHDWQIEQGGVGLHPRDRDPFTIRRRLRRELGRTAAHAAGILRFVGGQGGRAYADDWSLSRWEGIQCAKQKFLREHYIVKDDGDKPPTFVNMEVVAESASKARQSMWYSIILGMRDRAKKIGFVPIFITATLPPRYHLNPSKSGGDRRDVRLSPSTAAKELSARWHRALCLMRHHDIRPFGIRVVEPHEDGCPHLHGLLWCEPNHRAAIEAILRRSFPADGGSADAALQIKRWETRESREGRRAIAGDPASYIMTYVLETLRDGDPTDGDRDSSSRAKAWSAHTGIRRLSFVGLSQGIIGRWKAAQKAVKSSAPPTCPRARAILHAMKRKRWSSALALLGAFTAEPDERLVPCREVNTTKWGDEVRVTTGWHHPDTGEISLSARLGEWKIVAADRLADVLEGENTEGALSFSDSYPSKGASPPSNDTMPPPKLGHKGS